MKKKLICIILQVCLLLVQFSGLMTEDKIYASNIYGESIAITEVGQVVDSITFKGVTVNAIYKPRCEGYGTDSTYSCAAFVHRFYSNVFGVTVSNLSGSGYIPQVNSGYFTETTNPKTGDIIRHNNETHWAIVKSVDGNRITVIEQSMWLNDYKAGSRGRVIVLPDSNFSFFTYSGNTDGPGGLVENSDKFTNTKVEYVTDTTAKICTDISQATYPECGFYFGTSGELSSMKKVSEGPTVTNAKYNSYRLGEIYTDTNSYKWWNPLTPGTKYYYAFYVTSGNTTYVSTIQSFTTTGNSNVDKIAPVISNVSVKADVTGYTITCTVTDNVGVTKVTFPSWTDEGGTDDVITPWPEGVNTGSTYTYRVNDSDHNYARGKYSTDIHAYDAAVIHFRFVLFQKMIYL